HLVHSKRQIYGRKASEYTKISNFRAKWKPVEDLNKRDLQGGNLPVHKYSSQIKLHLETDINIGSVNVASRKYVIRPIKAVYHLLTIFENVADPELIRICLTRFSNILICSSSTHKKAAAVRSFVCSFCKFQTPSLVLLNASNKAVLPLQGHDTSWKRILHVPENTSSKIHIMFHEPHSRISRPARLVIVTDYILVVRIRMLIASRKYVIRPIKAVYHLLTIFENVADPELIRICLTRFSNILICSSSTHKKAAAVRSFVCSFCKFQTPSLVLLNAS
ncbi:hypothetical protein Tco_1050583, partial [Tanacetum coccineum]